MLKELVFFKDEVENECSQFLQCISKYPDIFQHSTIDRKVFLKYLSQVCTRCFGWGLPSTAMVPMGDNMNHADVSVVQEIIHKKKHLEGDEESNYFQKTKFMNDYSIAFDDSEAQDEKQLLNIKGRFLKENFEANKKFTSSESFRDQLARGIQLWDIAVMKDTFDEDNDTSESEEESDDDEQSEKMKKLLSMMSQLMNGKKASVKTLKKGFVFFMDQEKEELERLKMRIRLRKKLIN